MAVTIAGKKYKTINEINNVDDLRESEQAYPEAYTAYSCRAEESLQPVIEVVEYVQRINGELCAVGENATGRVALPITGYGNYVITPRFEPSKKFRKRSNK